MRELKDGDRIVGIENGCEDCEPSRDLDCIGVLGTIKGTIGGSNVKVRFDKNVNGWGDKRNGIPRGHGQTLCRKHLKLIEPSQISDRKALTETETLLKYL